MTLDKSPIAIIAGNGVLPIEAAECLGAREIPVHVLGIKGEADASVARFDHTFLSFHQLGTLFKLLKEKNISRILLAGGIVKRPDVDLLKMDWGTIRTLPEIVGVLVSGDNSILTGTIEIFRRRNIEVLRFPDVLPELMVTAGANNGRKPRSRDLERIKHGSKVIDALGPFDIGQGVVVIGDRAVAVEGAEGTDAMLERVEQLRRIGRLPAKKGGVLVKKVKPGQDERADLPTIGPRTIANLHAAGLNGVGVQAGKTIIVERDRTLALAKSAGVFVFGNPSEDAS